MASNPDVVKKRMACKPDFVQAEAVDDHSSGRTVTDTLLQPPEPAGAKAAPALAGHAVPTWFCFRRGLPYQ